MPRHISSMPNDALNNIITFPTFGKPITWVDQGIYFAMNTRTQAVHSIFQLVYDDAWHLFQLEQNDQDDVVRWSLLTGDDLLSEEDFVLNNMTSVQIRHHFSKPEYAEPRGAWQVVKNSKFGFGKFTPMQADEPVRYAMLMFINGEMLTPILIQKADEDALFNLEELAI